MLHDADPPPSSCFSETSSAYPFNSDYIIASRHRFICPYSCRDATIGTIYDGKAMDIIGQLRYELFIQRDKKDYIDVDHIKRTFVESIDQSSMNFYSCDGEKCLAAVRLSWAEDAQDDPHLKLVVEHSGIPASFVPATLVTSRLAIRDTRIAKLKMLAMMREAYYVGILSGALFCCVACRPALAPLFERMGFRPSGSGYLDDVAGLMTVMVLDGFDAAHLRKVQSPFLVDLEQYQALLTTRRGLA